MIIPKLIGIATAGYLANQYIDNQMNNIDTIIEPPVSNISIVMASLNEERYIEQSLLSIRKQSVLQQFPDKFEIILSDSCSTDNTVELAEPYIDKIIIAPRGKLTARNIAIQQAKGDIIVNVDADTKYNDHWLNGLLKPFKESDVVAVNGSTYDFSIKLLGNFNLHGILDYISRKTIYITRMVGRNSAMKKNIFDAVGRFNENVNQFNITSIFQEEELDFGDRLAMFGKIVYVPGASCRHLGGEKIQCRYISSTSDQTCLDIQNKVRF